MFMRSIFLFISSLLFFTIHTVMAVYVAHYHNDHTGKTDAADTMSDGIELHHWAKAMMFVG